MRDEKEVINMAANIKSRMLARAKKMEGMIQHIAKSDTGMVRKINDERRETMNAELTSLGQKQTLEGQQYAVLRWVLGVTSDVDPGNLELGK